MSNQDRFPGEYPPQPGFRPELHGLPEDTKADEISGPLKSQCGVIWVGQDVEQYNGALGVTQDFVRDYERPVGCVIWNNLVGEYKYPGNVSSLWGSGTLITNDLFLTAGHLFDSRDRSPWILPSTDDKTILPAHNIARNMHVVFNYQRDQAGNFRSPQTFDITKLIEYRKGDLDYAIVKLAGNPGAIYGVQQISNFDAAVNDQLCLIGHPAGQPKQIEAGPAYNFYKTLMKYNDIDTLNANSGVGVLHVVSGAIVGVHKT
jgi:V8-like Glu-specific endopeptidase